VIGTVQFTTQVSVEAEDDYAAKVALMAAVNRTITTALSDEHVVSDFEWTEVLVRDD
jgi:hypothetical protein